MSIRSRRRASVELPIAAIFVLWLVTNLIRSLHAAKRDKDLADGIAKAEPDPNETASAEEDRAAGRPA